MVWRHPIPKGCPRGASSEFLVPQKSGPLVQALYVTDDPIEKMRTGLRGQLVSAECSMFRQISGEAKTKLAMNIAMPANTPGHFPVVSTK